MPDAKLIKRSRANSDKRSLELLFDENIFKAIKSTIISPSDLGISFTDVENETINFYGSSDLYGKATLEQILSCIEKEQIGQRKGRSLLFKLEKIFYEDKEIWRK